jgi:acyl-coenzyme A thioesterase PaaI-like protein
MRKRRYQECEPISPFQALGITSTFVSGDPLSDRTRVEYFRKADSTVVAKAWFGPGTEGPPGFVHGGCIAAVLDEAMGAAVWAESHESVAGKLSVKFLQMLALGSNVVIHVRLTRTTGRKVFAHCKMSKCRALIAEGFGTFIKVSRKYLRNPIRSNVSCRPGSREEDAC